MWICTAVEEMDGDEQRGVAPGTTGLVMVLAACTRRGIWIFRIGSCTYVSKGYTLQTLFTFSLLLRA